MNQIKNSNVLIISLIFILSFTAKSFGNKIDLLKTDQDVEKFLHKENKKLKEFYISTSKELYYSDRHQKIADSIGVKPWQKIDFDNNGLTDLLIYGRWEGSKTLIAVLDQGKEFKFHSLNRGLINKIFFPVLSIKENQAVLLLNKENEYFDYDDKKDKKTISTDTLIYKFNNFIEPNNNRTNYKIKKIKYSTTMCFGTCPVFELEIDSDRTATYNAKQFNDKTGKFSTSISIDKFNSIIELLNYIDFPNLKNEYSVNWTDDQASTLTITYDNGKTKEISDYGMIGTYGLDAVYDKFFALRNNQNWIQIKKD